MTTLQPTLEELGIVGRSEAMTEVVSLVRQVAPTNLTVLLTGESGVGKEVVARAIHRLSARSGGKMLAVNCAAIPEALLESELFGHERGAFTGAVEQRKGLFEAAEGGTVFLDEIGEMSLQTQVKLLRVLETFEFTRVGSSEPRRANVRVIAATNRELLQDVESGAFRRDLYYRIALAQIHIPPLRDRREDIPLLFAHFAFRAAEVGRLPFGGISRDALDLLMGYRWPGNVRELRNFVERVVALEPGHQITPEIVERHLTLEKPTIPVYPPPPGAIVHMPGRSAEQAERELIYHALLELRRDSGAMRDLLMRIVQMQETPRPAALPPPPPTVDEALATLDDLSMEGMERRMIRLALDRYHGSRRAAARALGISERTLYRKINAYGLDDRVAADDDVEVEHEDAVE